VVGEGAAAQAAAKFARVVGVLGLVVLAAVSCGGGADEGDEEEEKPASAPPRVVVEGGESIVTLDADTLARAGVTIEPLQATSHQAEVTAFGSVLDLTGLAESGGARATASARLERAQAALTAARSEYERTRNLHADEVAASQKALEAASAALHADEAESRGAEAELAALEADARQRWGEVIAGWLAGGSPRLAALLRQEERLVQLTLPVGTALPAAPATATLGAGDGTKVAGRLVSPAPRTDARMQGASWFYTVPADSSPLPGAALTATLDVGTPSPGVIVPGAAVVWWQGKAWVYVERASGRFARRAISTDIPVEGGWFVSTGLAAGERAVVRGAQTLLSEEGRAAVHGSEG